jgi:putative ABC transport system substrate-binding protein
MKRREFITLLGGATAAIRASAARAQDNRLRRVAALWPVSLVMPERVAVLREELQKLGWREGRNLLLDVRTADGAALQVAAEEIVKSAPEVIVAFTGPPARALQMRTHTIPIVFTGGGDPVQGGMVSNAARPEGNITGFANIFPTLGGKYLELLKEAAPRVTRVAVLFPDLLRGRGQIASAESAAPALGATTVTIPFRNSAEIESAVEAFASEPNCALFLIGPSPSPDEFATIQRLALKYRLPLLYQARGEGVPTQWTPTTLLAGPRPTSIASCAARNRASCRCSIRPGSDW